MRHRNEARLVRAFYSDALRGRQLWPLEGRSRTGSLWFAIGRTVVEVPGRLGSAESPVRVVVDDPESLAERCWDAGFSVRVHEDTPEHPMVSVIDPFGRRIDLARSRASARRNRAA